ncbi:lysozyme inhibitor LprI family protein [Neorhizobium sp. NPDC001467]|uniref:lysozyme inhibitor LprI family protein n=1 Tax=Neorhizobium sp. NPDC001467 TaxID=3390595 RepID=UPI003CFFE1A5
MKTTIASILAALALCFTVQAKPASAASFDCKGATLAADEKAICEDRDLNDADVKMVTTFEILTGLLAMGTRGEMQDDQSAWLKRRQACGSDAECIRAAYAERLKQLSETFEKINRPL